MVTIEDRYRAAWAGTSEFIPHYTLGVLEVVTEALKPRTFDVWLIDACVAEMTTRYRVAWTE